MSNQITSEKGIRKYLELYGVFALIGGTTFGGGYAMLPILQREIVEKRGWATEDELMDYYAIGQCTPGVIAVNTSTFIGYKFGGIIGGIFATLGVVSPSILIISLIAAFLQNFADLPIVIHAFAGIRACVTALVLDAIIKLGKKSIIDNRCLIIFLAVIAGSMFTNISPVFFVVLAGVAGLLFKPDSDKKAETVAKKDTSAEAETASDDIDKKGGKA